MANLVIMKYLSATVGPGHIFSAFTIGCQRNFNFLLSLLLVNSVRCGYLGCVIYCANHFKVAYHRSKLKEARFLIPVYNLTEFHRHLREASSEDL